MSEHLVWISIVNHDANDGAGEWVGGVMGTVNDFEVKAQTDWKAEVIELAQLAGAMPFGWEDLCVETVGQGPVDKVPVHLANLPRWTFLTEDDLARYEVHTTKLNAQPGDVSHETQDEDPSAEDS